MLKLDRFSCSQKIQLKRDPPVYRISLSICRYTMNLLITCFLLGLMEALVTNENVVFHKENEVAITGSKWLFTFVIDLNPYKTS